MKWYEQARKHTRSWICFIGYVSSRFGCFISVTHFIDGCLATPLASVADKVDQIEDLAASMFNSSHRAMRFASVGFTNEVAKAPATPVCYRTKGTNVHPAALQIEELCVSFFASASLVSRPGSAAGRSLDGASGWTIEISTAVVVASIPVTWMCVGRRSQSGVGKMWGRLLQVCHRGPNIPVRLPVGRTARCAWRKCPFCGSSWRGRRRYPWCCRSHYTVSPRWRVGGPIGNGKEVAIRWNR